MSKLLKKIGIGGKELPSRVFLLGVEGIGKTTFGANAPRPLFITSEDGLSEFGKIERFSPDSWEEITGVVGELLSQDKIDYKSLVVDTSDWMERMVYEWVCADAGTDDINKAYGGYGKGHDRATSELVVFLRQLDQLRQKHDTRIIILGHVHIKPFTDPAGEAWDRWEAKGNKKFAGVIREWADCVLFATRDVHKIKRQDGSGEKAAGGERVIYTTWHPGFDAKNRKSLPAKLPLSWDSFEAAESSSKPEDLVERIQTIYPLVRPSMSEEDAKAWDERLKDLEGVSEDRLRTAISILQEIADGE
tara:strand:- start:5906 stop:6817 length:912 start_codon:yes stop_codon:yes gene_type:complete